MGEEGDSGHRLQVERVVVHFHRCEGGRVVLAVLFPRRSRLHCVNDLEKGLERGESSAADVARSCWYMYSVAVMSLCTVCITDSLKCL